jgi:hypothetical protein
MIEPITTRVPDDACLRCGNPLTEWGTHEFRTGGTTGGAKLLFGEWAELGEEKIPLELRYCGACGQVDIRLPAGANR